MTDSASTVDIGILTKGKPTLSMTLSSLLLQDYRNIRIHIVDTGDEPVIQRDDFAFAMRLAFDRGIRCDYEFSRERARRFSVGRLQLLEVLNGPYLCWMDDDMVLPSGALQAMAPVLRETADFGFVVPKVINAGFPGDPLEGLIHYAPGGVMHQDELVRNVLIDYYRTGVDVLDGLDTPDKVWEVAFLTELFQGLGRDCVLQEDNVIYHLDYRARQNWDLAERQLIQTSRQRAAGLIAHHTGGEPAAILATIPAEFVAVQAAPATRSFGHVLRNVTRRFMG